MARPKKSRRGTRAPAQGEQKRARAEEPSRQKARGVVSRATWGDVLALTLLSAVVNFHRLTAQSFWADEGNSIAQARRSLQEIFVHAALDIHPPLYYILLHAWTRVFGFSEFAIRSLSAVAGIGVVLLVWLVARRLWGETTARAAGLIAALHPALVYYAQEARMYIFVALWASLAGYALLTIILREGRARLALADAAMARGESRVVLPGPVRVPPQHPALLLGRWDLLFTLALAAGMWTHYAFATVAAVFALVYLAWMFTTRRSIPLYPRFIRLFTDYPAVLLLFVPWLPIALDRVRSWPRPSNPMSPAEALDATWRWLAVGPVPPAPLTRWLWVWAALILVALWPWRRSLGGRRVHWLSWGFPLLWVVGPVAMMIAMRVFKPAYLKFLIIAVPPFVILLARGVVAPWEDWGKRSQRRSRWLALLWLGASVLAVLSLQVVALGRYYYDPSAARDDYRGVVRYIEAVATPQDAIILNAPGQWDVFHYYYQGPLPAYRLPQNRPPDTNRLEQQLTTIAGKHTKLFVLFWATNESDPQGIMEKWLDTHAYKALDVWRGNVRFVIYATRRTSEEGAFSQDLDVWLGEVIRLEHFAIWQTRAAPGDVVQVRLRWRATRPIDRRYKVFIQLLGPGDRLIAQRDTEPVGGTRPTTTWQSGETIEDNYGLLIPLATPPGEYRLIAGMYEPETGKRLPVWQAGNEGDFVELPVRVQVVRPSAPPPVEVLPMRFRVDEQVGPIRVLGYDRYKRGFRHAPDTPVRPGEFLHVTIYWRAEEVPQERWRVTLSLVDGWGNAVANLTDDLAGPEYPTTAWAKGEVVRGEFDLYLPPDTRPDTYGLRVQLWKNDTPAGNPIPLGTVQISGG